jgi:hypothetical protein
MNRPVQRWNDLWAGELDDVLERLRVFFTGPGGGVCARLGFEQVGAFTVWERSER